MNYIRLNKNSEFFKDDYNAFFVGNVQDINIIVGANNTRKSRFLRYVINQEFKVIIKGPEHLNQLYLDSKGIFEGPIKETDPELTTKLVQLQFNGTNQPTPKYKNIKEFFGPRSQIDFFELKNNINSINETLAKAGTIDAFENLTVIIQRTYDVLELLEFIYTPIVQSECTTMFSGTYQHSNVKDITYLLLPNDSNHYIPNCKVKLNTIRLIKNYLELLLGIEFEICTKPMILIPVLRTSRMMGGSFGDIFEDTILKQHFQSSNNVTIIETGLKLYEKIGLARNGTRKQSRDFSAFEKFIGQVFFQSDDLHIVAHQTSQVDERHIKISLPNELEDISIQDLGDGIQGIINLLFPIFTADDGSWLFIDEPENHLHPGYQNILMQAIAENDLIKKKNLRFFINTHSNHILSGAFLNNSNTEIFVFSRRDMDSSNIVSFNGNEYNTLEMLGVFNTSVLISNCSVWIEGVTDRFYLKSFLYAFCNSLEETAFRPVEGLHFSYIEYGGANLAHYNFDHVQKINGRNDDATKNIREDTDDKIEAYFINNNVFLLADSDFDKAKHKPYEAIRRPNFKYNQTNLPEIENLLPDYIIEQYLVGLKCDKKEVDGCFPLDHKIKLGENLKGKIRYGKSFRIFDGDGGTLKDYYKKGLASYVHSKIMDKTFKWEDLQKSRTLKSTVEAMYDFIKEKNRK